MNQFEEKTLKRTVEFTGNLISLHVDTVQLPDGNRSSREVVTHPGAVAIIAITKENKLLFVKQYRKPLERSLVEIPAGKIEANEAPEVTAVRELEEETGYTTNNLTHLTSFYTSPGFADEIIHLYFTNELIPLEEKVAGDDDEFIEIIELTIEEAEQYVKDKKIYDAKTAYALLYVKLMEK
ncbi:MAG TPA: NUDIX hydrolase [Pseudogracilibacillus sp.]|nr:NUDIX hydrolase [Pseudogracilibacillus sp.]